MGLGLYIHVPFCPARCHFCAFYLQIYREDAAQAFLAGLRREIQLCAERGILGGRSLDTVYFGGGTPTTLGPRTLTEVLGLLRDHYGLKADAEITLEAHPETVTPDGLAHLAEAGFNRFSIGVQSADPRELAQVGRATMLSRFTRLRRKPRLPGLRSRSSVAWLWRLRRSLRGGASYPSTKLGALSLSKGFGGVG